MLYKIKEFPKRYLSCKGSLGDFSIMSTPLIPPHLHLYCPHVLLKKLISLVNLFNTGLNARKCKRAKCKKKKKYHFISCYLFSPVLFAVCLCVVCICFGILQPIFVICSTLLLYLFWIFVCSFEFASAPRCSLFLLKEMFWAVAACLPLSATVVIPNRMHPN